MKCYSLTLAALVTAIAGSSCWADQNQSGFQVGKRGASFGSSSSRLKAIGPLLGGNGSPFGRSGSPFARNGSVGNGAQVSRRASTAGGTATCKNGSGLGQLGPCPQGGNQFGGPPIYDQSGGGQSLPLATATQTEAPTAAVVAQTTNTNTDDGANSDLEEIGGLFADSSDDGRYNVEVRDPLNQNFRVVKSDLSVRQANRLGDQLSEAFWVVTQAGGSSPTKKMVGDRAAAQKLAKELATDSSGGPPVVESIAYRIVSADAPAKDTPNLGDLVESALEEPESYSDKPDPAAPETSATFEDLFVDADGEPRPAQVWAGVSEGSDGRPQKFTLRLDADGQAEITVPTTKGEERKIESSYRMDEDVLVLTGDGGQETVLGRIVQEDDRRMTLVRATGQITLFRQ